MKAALAWRCSGCPEEEEEEEQTFVTAQRSLTVSQQQECLFLESTRYYEYL